MLKRPDSLLPQYHRPTGALLRLTVRTQHEHQVKFILSKSAGISFSLSTIPFRLPPGFYIIILFAGALQMPRVLSVCLNHSQMGPSLPSLGRKCAPQRST